MTDDLKDRTVADLREHLRALFLKGSIEMHDAALDELARRAEANAALREAVSVLVAEALSVARTQVKGYGLMGKLASLRRSAEGASAALAAAKEGGAK